MTMVEATVSLRAERVSVATGLLKMVQRPRLIANGEGTCQGSRTCTDEGLSECDAPIPAAEVCNGLMTTVTEMWTKLIQS